jgi:hypothetical protein
MNSIKYLKNETPNLERQRVYAFDFDGVIATYEGFKGVDVFGEPIKSNIDLMKQLKEEGNSVIIFTTRPATPKMMAWLKEHNVICDYINPTGVKPLYDVFIDDNVVNYHGQDVKELSEEVKKIVNKKKGA